MRFLLVRGVRDVSEGGGAPLLLCQMIQTRAEASIKERSQSLLVTPRWDGPHGAATTVVV